MRSLRIATCTSGDPVSLSCVRYESMISDFRSFGNATAYLRERLRESHIHVDVRTKPPLTALRIFLSSG